MTDPNTTEDKQPPRSDISPALLTALGELYEAVRQRYLTSPTFKVAMGPDVHAAMMKVSNVSS